jgi:hypothetical protein
MWAERPIRRKSKKADSAQLTVDGKRRASAASISTSEKLELYFGRQKGAMNCAPTEFKANLAFACAARSCRLVDNRSPLAAS